MSSKVLIVGSGVIGLRTATELLRRQTRICLVSPQHPLHPSTCSMGAGGLWMPFHCDDPRTNKWAFETLNELLNCTSSMDNQSLVEVVPTVRFHKMNNQQPPDWTRHSEIQFQCLTLDQLYQESCNKKFRLPKRETMEEAGYSCSWLFQAPIVDSPRMLTYMLNEITSSEYSDKVNVETGKWYSTVQEMIVEAETLGCDTVINCTGLGAKLLCKDDALVGARGVLLHYDRSSCTWSCQNEATEMRESAITVEDPPFGSEHEPCYIIPRGNVIAVGGTYLEKDDEASIRPQEWEKLLGNARLMGIDTDKTDPIGHWVGFRPYRPQARLEVDETMCGSTKGITVVHNFGYGGSGWTVFVGAAREAASLVSSS